MYASYFIDFCQFSRKIRLTALLYKVRKWCRLQIVKVHYKRKVLQWWFIFIEKGCWVFFALSLISTGCVYFQLPVIYTVAISEFENKYTNIAKVENDMGITCILWIHIHACFKERCENKQNQLGGQVHKIHLNVLSISAIGNNYRIFRVKLKVILLR